MQFIDILCSIALLFALYKGYTNGLLVELASFISLLLGLYIAIHFSDILKNVLSEIVSWSPRYIQVIAFALTFVMVLFGIHFLAKLISNIADFAHLGWLNKLAGAGFRLLKTVLVLSVLIGLIQKINFNNWLFSDKTKKDSLFYEPIQEVVQIIYPSFKELLDEIK